MDMLAELLTDSDEEMLLSEVQEREQMPKTTTLYQYNASDLHRTNDDRNGNGSDAENSSNHCTTLAIYEAHHSALIESPDNI